MRNTRVCIHYHVCVSPIRKSRHPLSPVSPTTMLCYRGSLAAKTRSHCVSHTNNVTSPGISVSLPRRDMPRISVSRRSPQIKPKKKKKLFVHSRHLELNTFFFSPWVPQTRPRAGRPPPGLSFLSRPQLPRESRDSQRGSLSGRDFQWLQLSKRRMSADVMPAQGRGV